MNITHIAIGAAGYDVPMGASTGRSPATALRDEKNRVEVQDVRTVAPNQKDLSFVVQPTEGYYIREIGFFLEGGTLYAIAAHATLALDYASPTTRNLFALEYVIEDGDEGSINIVSNGPPLNLLMTEELAILGRLGFINALQTMRLEDRIRRMTGEN